MLLPNRRYTKEQIVQGMNQGEADRLKQAGYVLRFDALDGTYMVVPWMEASGSAIDGARPVFTQTDKVDYGELTPIVKRTAQQRLDSLMLRFVDDCKATGTVPGLDDDRISFILGEAWKTGNTQITGEVVRQVARHFLEDAQRKQAAIDYKKVTVTRD